MKQKKIITIQYIALAFLSLIVFFLPFCKYEISIPALNETVTKMNINGLNFVATFFEEPTKYATVDELLPLFYALKKYFCILAVFTLFVPLLLLIASGVLHILHMRKEKMPAWQVAFPLLSIISMAGGWFGVGRALQSAVNDFMKDMAGQVLAGTGGGMFASRMDVSSFYGDIMNDMLENTVQLKLSGSVGYYLLLIVALILLIEDIILPRLWKERYVEKIISVPGGGQAGLPENMVPDGVYKEDISQKRGEGSVGTKPERVIETWSDSTILERQPQAAPSHRPNHGYGEDPTQRTGQRKGLLIGIRGEYAGAEVQMLNGEKIVIGRSREKANLILNNPKVSRKHCEVSYDAVEDKYVMVNCSLNGTFLSGGQLLEQGKRYHLPHGTIFRVNKEDEFKLL